MKNICRNLAATLACALAPAVLADPPADVMNIVREADIKWQSSLLVPGLATAVVQGDPKDPGKPYVVRVRFPPNTMSPPHFHPEARHSVSPAVRAAGDKKIEEDPDYWADQTMWDLLEVLTGKK